MCAPLIGITTYGRNEAGDYAVPVNYVASARRAGGVPLLIAPGEARIEEILSSIDGLMLAGGGDLDPSCYGGVAHETIYMVDRDRDDMELALTRGALETDTPLLAICRGSQVVNVALGGTLLNHLPDVVGDAVNHRLPPREPVLHRLRMDPDSQVAKAMGVTECGGMSWHHEAVSQLAAGCKAVAWAPDGVLEAFEIEDNASMLAVQWHPEITAADDAVHQRLFDWLVEQAK